MKVLEATSLSRLTLMNSLPKVTPRKFIQPLKSQYVFAHDAADIGGLIDDFFHGREIRNPEKEPKCYILKS